MLYCYLCTLCNLLFYLREASVHPANDMHLGLPFNAKFIRCPDCGQYHTLERAEKLDIDTEEE